MRPLAFATRKHIAVLSTVLFTALFAVAFAAPVPTFINYQGYITNASGTPQTGIAPITVRLYNAQTAGTLLFEEQEGSTTITNGYFTIPVGKVGDVNGATPAVSLTDLPFDTSYYVTVELGAPYNTGEMTLSGGLRSQMGVSPFAMISYGALTSTSSTGLTTAKGKMYFDTTTNQLSVYNGTSWTALDVVGSGITSLNGLSGVSQFLTVGTAGTDIGISSVGSTHTINIPNAGATSRGVVSTGTQVFAGDKTFGGKVSLSNASSTNITLLGALFDTGSSSGLNGMVLQTTGTSTRWVATSSLGISGSLSGGSNGFLSRWTSASTLTAGVLRDNGTVAGVNASSSSSNFTIGATGALDPLAVLSAIGASLFTVLSGGNVGVGTSTAPSKLTVNGDIRIAQGSGGQLIFADGSTMSSSGLGSASSLSATGDAIITADSDANATGDLVFKTGSTERLRIANDGTMIFGSAAGLTATTINNISSSSSMPVILSTKSVGSNPKAITVSGRYAYIANDGSDTMSVIDVSNPLSPTTIATKSVSGGTPRAIFAAGKYVYVVNDGSNTVSIFDVSDASNPVILSKATTGSNPRGIYVAGRYMYIVNDSSATMSIIDIANPEAPVTMSSISTGTTPQSVFVTGRYAYVVANGSNKLYIYDVANPSNPVQVSNFTVAGGPQSLYVSGRYAYIASSASSTLSIVDISNPRTPVLSSTASTGLSPTSIMVSGRYAFVANNGGTTVSMFDVSSSTSPILVSSPVTGTSPYALYVSGRYLYVTQTGANNVVILDLGGLESTSAIIHSLEAGNLQVRNSIIAQGNIQAGSSITVGMGGLFSQGSGAFYVATTSSLVNVQALTAMSNDNSTNTILDVFSVGRGSYGTSSAGIGSGILFKAQNSSSTMSSAARIASYLTNVTPGSEGSVLSFFTRTGGSSLLERARISEEGYLLVGTTSANAVLSIVAPINASPLAIASASGTSYLSILSTGDIGIGTSTQTAELALVQKSGDPDNVFDIFSSAGLSFFSMNQYGKVALGTSTSGSQLDVYTATSSANVDIFRVISDVTTVANVVFKIKANGDIFTDGATTIGTPADLAENYPTLENLESGDVVSLSSTTVTWHQTLSNGDEVPYQMTTIRKAEKGEEVLGVISTRPGILLGGNTERGVAVAFSGRVPVKVTNENGQVHKGDSLTVSSSTKGYAMKFKGTGYTIGRAISDASTATTSTILMVVENKQKAFAVTDIEGLTSFATSSASFAKNTQSVYEMLTDKLRDGNALVVEYFALSLKAVAGYFDILFAKEVYADKVDTETLCVGKEGDKTCITKEKLDQLLLLQPSATSSSSSGGTTQPTPTPSLEASSTSSNASSSPVVNNSVPQAQTSSSPVIPVDTPSQVSPTVDAVPTETISQTAILEPAVITP
jgi:hypothetical protein